MEPGPASPQATADSTASVAAELRRGLETLANSSPNLEERKQAAAALKAIEEEEKRADAAKATARSYLTALKPKASLDDSTVRTVGSGTDHDHGRQHVRHHHYPRHGDPMLLLSLGDRHLDTSRQPASTRAPRRWMHTLGCHPRVLPEAPAPH